MIVRVHNDVTLLVVDDPEHDQKFKGSYIYYPNSVRRDVPFTFAAAHQEKFTKKPQTPKE